MIGPWNEKDVVGTSRKPLIPGKMNLILRFFWYLLLLFLIVLFYDTPEKDFRYLGP